jgi:hypothetical protein
MNVYQYIASSNPSFAKQVCADYGYKTVNVRTPQDLAVCLSRLVQLEGEPAFKDIMMGHPDRDVLLEISEKPAVAKFSSADGSNDISYNHNFMNMGGCGCMNCRQRQNQMYLNADGGAQKESSAMSLTSVSIIAASLLLAVAVLTKNN